MSTEQIIRTGQSFAKDPHLAVKEFYDAVNQKDMALVIFFCSSHFDLNIIANEINSHFQNVIVVGCTTAGEIGPAGYKKHTLSGASFSSDDFTVTAGHYDDLHQIENAKGQAFVNNLLEQFESHVSHPTANNSFAFLMIDGLSLREEQTVRIFQNALGDIALFGGSAGDDLNFKHTWIFSEGKFRTDSAALILVNTNHPFKIFKAQHFICGDEKLIVTKADPSLRNVSEINGYPAAEEYARIVGSQVDKLDPMQFSSTPVVVRINGVDYVRSIQKVNADNSLTFYCAIDNGLVFMAAHGIDLIKNLEQTFNEIESEIGKPQLIIACDCILRNLEIEREGLKPEVEKIFMNNNVIGFSTYGEQFMGVHINQTITGLAIGESKVKNNA